MKILIVVLCSVALLSCSDIPERPYIVTEYKTMRTDSGDCQRSYRVIDKNGIYYYFTDIVNCLEPSTYMIGDTLN